MKCVIHTMISGLVRLQDSDHEPSVTGHRHYQDSDVGGEAQLVVHFCCFVTNTTAISTQKHRIVVMNLNQLGYL